MGWDGGWENALVSIIVLGGGYSLAFYIKH